jgi:TPR repeat protein
MVANGRGTTKNDTEAIRLYRLAAAQGNSKAIAAMTQLKLIDKPQ